MLLLLRFVVHPCIICVFVVLFCFLGGSFPRIACGVVVLSFSVSCVCSGHVVCFVCTHVVLFVGH